MPHPTDVKIGARVREIRLARGLSQSALADRLGVSFQQVQKYERGSNRMGASRLEAVCNVLGISVADLFEAEGPVSNPDDIRLTRAAMARARAIESIADPTLKAAILDLIRTVSRVPARDAAFLTSGTEGARHAAE